MSDVGAREPSIPAHRRPGLPFDATADEWGDAVTRPEPVRWRLRHFAVILGIAAGVALALLLVYVARGFRFPLGADAPVYLWWARLASVDRLSSVGNRPGVPALLLVLSGTLHAPLTAVVAALEAVLAGVLGLGAWALLRRSSKRRGVSTLAALLTGAFAVNLAIGYLASVTFAALFLAGAAVLMDGSPRGRVSKTVAAAALLAAAALAHPLFSLVGVAILLATAALAYRHDRRVAGPNQAGAIVGAVVAAGAILGAVMLSLLPGPAPIDAITSKDGFLRRAGLTSELHSLYAERLRQHWARYVSYISIPLALTGLRETEDLLREFLFSWLVVTIAGVVVALATGIAPADRFVSFAFVIPILAALGVAVVRGILRERDRFVLMNALFVLLVGAMLAGAGITWARQEPYIASDEVAAARAAGEALGGLPLGTPLVFVVDGGDATAGFLAPRAENVIRAAMPPDRIADVHVYVGTLQNEQANRPTLRSDPQFDALSRTYLMAIDAAEQRTSQEPVTFVLEPFAPAEFATAGRTGLRLGNAAVLVRPQDVVAGAPASVAYETLDPSSPPLIVATALGILVLLFVCGLGWARSAIPRPEEGFALAPAFGGAALLLGGIAFERLGVALNVAGATLISVLVGGSGYAAWWLRHRRSLRRGERDPLAQAST